MPNTDTPKITRKVRLWPGLRLEICGQNADTQLTADEAMGLASALLLEARETLRPSHHTHPAGAGLAARSTPDGLALSVWNQHVELVATLTREQSSRLAQTIASSSCSLCAACVIHQFQPIAVS